MPHRPAISVRAGDRDFFFSKDVYRFLPRVFTIDCTKLLSILQLPSWRCLMTRPCADRLTVTSKNDRLRSAVDYRSTAFLHALDRACLAVLLLRLEPLFMPIAPTLAGQASVGATIFGGDRLSTEQSGSVQVRLEPPACFLQCEQRHLLSG